MQALILAAGRGSRLSDKSGGTSKALLEVGHRALVEHAIETLAGCGVGPVGMVVGFAAHEVEERVGIKAEYITNSRWSVTNSLYSFWLARDWVKGDVMVLNCDVLFCPQVLERLLDVEGDALAFDSTSGERREEMSVQVINDHLADMSKTLPTQLVSGENLGILKLTHETAKLVFARAGELIAEGREKDWLGSAIRDVAKSRPIRAVDVSGLPWTEIDFPNDLQRARRDVWPRMQSLQRRQRTPFRVARLAGIAALALAMTFVAFKAWVKPTEITWDSVALIAPDLVAVTNGSTMKKVARLQSGQSVSARVSGPTTLRIDTRPILAVRGTDVPHYVLVVRLDGQRVQWHSRVGEASGTWHLGNEYLGKRFRTELEIPSGEHEVEATLAASDTDGCVVRFTMLAGDM